MGGVLKNLSQEKCRVLGLENGQANVRAEKTPHVSIKRAEMQQNACPLWFPTSKETRLKKAHS